MADVSSKKSSSPATRSSIPSSSIPKEPEAKPKSFWKKHISGPVKSAFNKAKSLFSSTRDPVKNVQVKKARSNGIGDDSLSEAIRLQEEQRRAAEYEEKQRALHEAALSLRAELAELRQNNEKLTRYLLLRNKESVLGSRRTPEEDEEFQQLQIEFNQISQNVN